MTAATEPRSTKLSSLFGSFDLSVAAGWTGSHP